MFGQKPHSALRGVFKGSSFTPSKRPSSCMEAAEYIEGCKDHAYAVFPSDEDKCTDWFHFLAESIVTQNSPVENRMWTVCNHVSTDRLPPIMESELELDLESDAPNSDAITIDNLEALLETPLAIDTDDLYSLDMN